MESRLCLQWLGELPTQAQRLRIKRALCDRSIRQRAEDAMSASEFSGKLKFEG